MFESLLQNISAALMGLALSVAGLFGYTTPISIPNDNFTNAYDISHLEETVSSLSSRVGAIEESQKLGAVNPTLPTPVAFFQSSLQASISSSATSFTLVSNTDKAGTTLASSTYAFVIDEGTASEEMIIADCFPGGAKTCANAIRGVSVVTGTTTVSALQKAHRRGASVKITDGPLLLSITRTLNGIGTFPSVLSYASGVGCTGGSLSTSLCDKAYIDSTANAGAATSTESNGGIVELATALEAASSTDLGGNQPLVLQAKNATSTPANTTLAALKVPVAKNNGKLHQLWLDLTELFAFSSITATNATSTNLGITGVTSSLLKTNSSGSVQAAVADTDYATKRVVLRDHSTETVAMTNSGTTYTIRHEVGVGTFTPATTDAYRIGADISSNSGSGTETLQIIVGNGSASTTVASMVQTSIYANAHCTVEIFLKNSVSAWDYATFCISPNAGTYFPTEGGASAVDLSNGFNIQLTGLNSSQNTLTGTSKYVNVERYK